jgi:hypothetical protein
MVFFVALTHGDAPARPKREHVPKSVLATILDIIENKLSLPPG